MGLAARYVMGFYFDQLGIDQKCDYQKVAQAVSKYQSAVKVDASDSKKIHQTLMAVKYDNPELCFWSLDETTLDGDTLNLIYYTRSEEEASELIQTLRDKRRTILDNILKEDGCTSQEELLKRVYDYLVQTTEYADDELQKPVCSRWIYDIRGVLLKGKGVCLGIAMAVNYLCMALHIPSILVTGEAKIAGWNGNHGWNMVELEGEYFHMDVTSAIVQDEALRDKDFLMKDEDIAGRSWSKTLYPKAV